MFVCVRLRRENGVRVFVQRGLRFYVFPGGNPTGALSVLDMRRQSHCAGLNNGSGETDEEGEIPKNEEQRECLHCQQFCCEICTQNLQ